MNTQNKESINTHRSFAVQLDLAIWSSYNY